MAVRPCGHANTPRTLVAIRASTTPRQTRRDPPRRAGTVDCFTAPPDLCALLRSHAGAAAVDVIRLQRTAGNRAIAAVLAAARAGGTTSPLEPHFVVQRALRHAPRTIRDPRQAQAMAPDLGETSPPVNFQRPTAVITTRNTGRLLWPSWTATVSLSQSAQEGDNDSKTVPSGTYVQPWMFQGGALGPYTPGQGNYQIHGQVSSSIARMSWLAEQEHCRDILRAYQLSLDVAEEAIRDATEQTFGTTWTQQGAIDLAMERINERIAFHVYRRNGGPPFRLRQPDDPSLDRIYQDLHARTQTERDGLGLHTFRPDDKNVIKQGRTWEIRNIVPGPRTRIPGPRSEEVIHF